MKKPLPKNMAEGAYSNYVKRDGKVVDIFRFLRDGKAIEFEVRLSKRLAHKVRFGEKPETESAEFLVYVPQDKGDEKKFAGTDIELLRQAVREEVERLNEMGWTRMFIVSISGGWDTWLCDKSEALEFKVQTVYTGKTREGKPVYRTDNDQESRYYEGSPLKEDTGRRKETRSMVEGTEENEAILEHFAKGLVEMRKRIGEFLGQKNVTVALQRIADSMKALPGPGKEKP